MSLVIIYDMSVTTERCEYAMQVLDNPKHRFNMNTHLVRNRNIPAAISDTTAARARCDTSAIKKAFHCRAVDVPTPALDGFQALFAPLLSHALPQSYYFRLAGLNIKPCTLTQCGSGAIKVCRHQHDVNIRGRQLNVLSEAEARGLR
ncbi:hypothetical protein EVAR_921_1 [Eumeta japonica]|uniref:Uncharacterized protein n=1 Tax=Eumeta variegata TaxID=151549 RepID=A0A4C1SEN1_EUMVA|nr:hypothetical protein EVAR_921_1 [Eumeta japonica]